MSEVDSLPQGRICSSVSSPDGENTSDGLKFASNTTQLVFDTMPYDHRPIYSTSKRPRHISIRGRVYRTVDQCPKYTSISTQDDGHRRFAILQGVFTDDSTQPRVWNCEVTVVDIHGLHHNFQFFFKNDRRLPENLAIESINPDTHWKGDAVVLRVAANCSRVVNMRTDDAFRADFALNGCVECINAGKGTPLKIPKRIVLYMLS